jgi:hypothetical protein
LAFGVTLFWGQGALAYGPQWRPAPTAHVAHLRSAAQPRVANMPSFRPPAARARPPARYAERWSRAQPRYFRPHRTPRRYVDWRDTRDQRLPPAQFARAPVQRIAPPAWSRPGWPMMPTWAGPVGAPPMPSWQHGYGGVMPIPGVHPLHVPVVAAPAWSSEPRNYRQERWALERAPTAAVMPPLGPPPVMTPGGWRPVSGTGPAVGYRGQEASVRPGQLGAGPAWRHEPTALATPGSKATPRGLYPSWRPARPIAAQPGLAANDFRPVPPSTSARAWPGNGRSLEYSVPSRRQALPGWATTYDAPRTAAVCDWCNGS